MSEFLVDPGTTIPFSLGPHLQSSRLIKPFHNIDALKTKFSFEVLRLILGKHSKKFVSLGLGLSSLWIEIGNMRLDDFEQISKSVQYM